MITKLKFHLVNLNFHELTKLHTLSLECYSDASFGNQEGYIFVMNQYNLINVVSWQSTRIRKCNRSRISITAARLPSQSVMLRVNHCLILYTYQGMYITKC